MPKLIKDKQVVEDLWQLVEDKSIDDAANLPEGDILIPLQVWLSCKDKLSDSSNSIAVWLDSDEHPSELIEDSESIAFIAINFPVFADGRGYSYATLLRQRYNYQGEIRAIGDVLRDQLFYMRRCGFDTFVMREQDRSDEALESLNDFNDTYQSSASNPQPLFQRR